MVYAGQPTEVYCHDGRQNIYFLGEYVMECRNCPNRKNCQRQCMKLPDGKTCGDCQYVNWCTTVYCPNCGAKMDGGSQ